MSSSSDQFSVGVIGLGAIGAGVANNLQKVSRGPVLVFTRSAEKLAAWTSRPGFAAATPREMGAACDFVFLVVPGLGEVEGLVAGPDGLLSAAREGLTIVDLTTSDPDKTRELGKKALARGVNYLDSGTSGGPGKADIGQLVLTVGGDEEAFQRAQPVLEAIAEASFLVGPSGAGHTLKLLHNNLTYGNFLMVCEAGRVAERAGIPLARMIEIFNQSNARSYATEVRFPNHILTGGYDSRGRMSIVHKDLCLGAALDEQAGLSTGIVEAIRDFVGAAIERGMADEDFMLLYRDYEEILATLSGKAPAKSSGGGR